MYHLRNADEANNLAGASQRQTQFDALLARLPAEEKTRLAPLPGPYLPLILASQSGLAGPPLFGRRH